MLNLLFKTGKVRCIDVPLIEAHSGSRVIKYVLASAGEYVQMQYDRHLSETQMLLWRAKGINKYIQSWQWSDYKALLYSACTSADYRPSKGMYTHSDQILQQCSGIFCS